MDWWLLLDKCHYHVLTHNLYRLFLSQKYNTQSNVIKNKNILISYRSRGRNHAFGQVPQTSAIRSTELQEFYTVVNQYQKSGNVFKTKVSTVIHSTSNHSSNDRLQIDESSILLLSTYVHSFVLLCGWRRSEWMTSNEI